MGYCVCKGIEVAVIGALFIINDQGWIWGSLSAWLLVGIILLVVGIKKVVWRCCPVHGCGDKGMMKAKKGK